MRKNLAILGIVFVAIILLGAVVVDAKGGSFGGGRSGGMSASRSSSSFKSTPSLGGKVSSSSSVKSVNTASTGKLTVANSKAFVTAKTPRYNGNSYAKPNQNHYVRNYYGGMPMTDVFLMYYVWYGLGHMAADNDGNAVYIIDDDKNGTKGQAVKIVDDKGNVIPYTDDEAKKEEAKQEEAKKTPMGSIVGFAALGLALFLARGRLK